MIQADLLTISNQMWDRLQGQRYPNHETDFFNQITKPLFEMIQFHQNQTAKAEKEANMQPTTETTKTYGSGQTAPDYDSTAKVAHEVNRAFCESIGDNSQPAWENAPEWQKASARNGVKAHLDSGLTLTPEQSHESWMAEKEADGWIFGEVKDPENKTHPCMLPYNKLPIQQRTKDYLFRAVVHSIHS